jgi:hypothetical protein
MKIHLKNLLESLDRDLDPWQYGTNSKSYRTPEVPMFSTVKRIAREMNASLNDNDVAKGESLGAIPSQCKVDKATHVTILAKPKVPVKVKKVAHTVTHRPPADDPKRGDWDRAAQYAWHLFMVLLAIGLIVATDRMFDATMSAIITDKIPEGISDTIDYLKKL